MITPQGFLKITGRIKELIITAGGENVAPVPIEDNFKTLVPFVSNIMVIGDDKKFLSALISFKVDIDPKTGEPSATLSPECINSMKTLVGVEPKTVDEAKQDSKILAFITKAIEATNKKSVSRAAHVRKWHYIPTDFSVPGGELTPTLKLKRRVTEKKYAADILRMYEDEAKL